MINKPYSEFSFAIDLIINEYDLTNPILIAEKVKEELDIDLSIHQIADYLEVELKEDHSKVNRAQYYNIIY